MIASPGNEEVILALETLLAKAREGKAGYMIALMVLDHGQNFSGGWFGCHALAPIGMNALDQLSVQINTAYLNTILPMRPANVPADRVCLSIPASPLSFDFINWLVDAEMTRRREGAPAPLKVCFWLGRDGKTGFDRPSKQLFFENVIRPALALIGAVEDPFAVDGRFKEFFSSRDIVAASRAGEKIPRLKSPVSMPEYRGCVTITLRECDHYPHRNSNKHAWADFARYLIKEGERVVFVRDTAKADSPFDQFETCPQASIDLHKRLALYEAASMNLFVSNGPGVLGNFGDWPWMMFVKIEADGHDYTPNTPSFFRDYVGIDVGSQYPWSRPDQRIIWAGDDYDTLVNAWRGRYLTTQAAE